MPISKQSFEQGNFKKQASHDRLKHPVMRFLRKNNMRAYTIKEISKEVKMNEFTIRSFLYDARKDKIVIHKKPYYLAVVNNKPKKKK